ncbi:MAG: hypothetical protein AB1714_27315 [Acidobacteriota bacterium]
MSADRAAGADPHPRRLAWLRRFWEREARRHLPPGFDLQGVMGGSTGTTFPAFLTIIALSIGACIVAAAWAALVLDWPATIGVIGVVVASVTIPHLLSELGVYRSVLLVRSPDRLIVIERAGFDRLVAARAYSLPLRVALRWEGAGTLVFGDERIHVHVPQVSRPYLATALDVQPMAAPGAGPAFEDITAQTPRGTIWHTVHVAGILWVIASLWFIIACGVAGLGWPASWPMPLACPTGVVADSAGQIAVLLQAYGRVQIYDTDGRFVRGLNIANGGRGALIAVDTLDRLWVYCEGGGALQRYAPDGGRSGQWIYVTPAAPRRIRLWPGGNAGIDRTTQLTMKGQGGPVQLGGMLFTNERSSVDFVDASGARYELPGPHWLPCVRRNGGDARALTLWGPWWLIPIGFPLPGLPAGLSLAVLGYYAARHRSTTDLTSRRSV